MLRQFGLIEFEFKLLGIELLPEDHRCILTHDEHEDRATRTPRKPQIHMAKVESVTCDQCSLNGFDIRRFGEERVGDGLVEFD